MNVAKNECFGDNNLYLKLRAAISEPIGDTMAMSKVNN